MLAVNTGNKCLPEVKTGGAVLMAEVERVEQANSSALASGDLPVNNADTSPVRVAQSAAGATLCSPARSRGAPAR